MILHNHKDEFSDLISTVSAYKHLPEKAIARDYYIVMFLKNLSDSNYADRCVFKGGTSLSKCYPGSIDRFSKDIDLTYLGMDETDNSCEKNIKRIESIISAGAKTEKIISERSKRSKSMYLWIGDKADGIKLEIGSSVKPEPYSKRTLKTYIQEFLEANDGFDDIKRYELQEITINVLNVERTFVDKLMSVKRHAICGTIDKKVRHIYDVTKLFEMSEVKRFLEDKDEMKRLIQITKQTDEFYLQKRNIKDSYNPNEKYDFESWKYYLDDKVRAEYENLHKELLYTDEKQKLADAIKTFSEINAIF